MYTYVSTPWFTLSVLVKYKTYLKSNKLSDINRKFDIQEINWHWWISDPYIMKSTICAYTPEKKVHYL